MNMLPTKETATLPTKKIFIIAAISIVLGVLFDYLFYSKEIGISLFIYVGILIAVLFGYLFSFKVGYNKAAVWLLPAIIFFASMAGIKDNEFLLFVDCVMVFGFLLLLALHITGPKTTVILCFQYIKKLTLLPFEMLGKSFNAFGRMLSARKSLQNHKKITQIISGIIVTIPIVLFFLYLFSSADLVFKKIVTDLFNFEFNIDPDVGAQIFWAIATAFTWLGVYSNILERPNANEKFEVNVPTKKFKMGNIEAYILFTALSGLFFTFVAIQIKYLFAGHSAISELGYTYAEYAHKGFGELIIVAILTFGLIFAAENYIERKDNKPSKTFKALASLLMFLVLVIIGSAFTRLNIYEEAYGFTVLRILVQAFIIWVGLVFVWLMYKILKGIENNTFVLGIFSSAVLLLTVFSIINPDAFVARKNINQFAHAGNLDTKYLATLSADATPAIIGLLEMTGAKDKYGNDLPQKAADILKSHFDDAIKEPWQSYNISRGRAVNLIHSKWHIISILSSD